jgi:hypothetical protein
MVGDNARKWNRPCNRTFSRMFSKKKIMSVQLRDYQREAVDKCKDVLQLYNVCYLAAEPRCGKNFMSFHIAQEMGWKRVAFITKKGALEGCHNDWRAFGNKFIMFFFNFEQTEKILAQKIKFDGVIIDEAHSIAAYPKPSGRTKFIKELATGLPVLLMSGTPTPEGYSQIYHQYWVSDHSPFKGYSNFYRWAKEFVDVKVKMRNGFSTNDYKKADEKRIKEITKKYTVPVSQVDAGFVSFVEEEVLIVKIDERIYDLMKLVKKNKVYKFRNGKTILADTPVKMQGIFHQLSSGTIKITEQKEDSEEVTYYALDESKAWFIKTKFAGQKIAIYYKYIEEGNVLRRVFPNHTDSTNVFNGREDMVFIRQMVAGREGVNLSTCDALVMYNIDFSATTYWQVRARMQTKTRTKASKLYWIFSDIGIEQHVYEAVAKKKDFTLDYFRASYDKIGQPRQLSLI